MNEGTGLTVDVRAEFPAAPERVWQALTAPDQLAGWWPYLHLDARPGGGFREMWTDEHGRDVRTCGRVLVVEPPRRLGLSWKDDGWRSETTVEILLARTSHGTTVTVSHRGWEQLPDGARLARQHAAGWQMHLANLRAFCARP
jgi:uncharacterized protein YndB with AHSA1/START domain